MPWTAMLGENVKWTGWRLLLEEGWSKTTDFSECGWRRNGTVWKKFLVWGSLLHEIWNGQSQIHCLPGKNRCWQVNKNTHWALDGKRHNMLTFLLRSQYTWAAVLTERFQLQKTCWLHHATGFCTRGKATWSFFVLSRFPGSNDVFFLFVCLAAHLMHQNGKKIPDTSNVVLVPDLRIGQTFWHFLLSLFGEFHASFVKQHLGNQKGDCLQSVWFSIFHKNQLQFLQPLSSSRSDDQLPYCRMICFWTSNIQGLIFLQGVPTPK